MPAPATPKIFHITHVKNLPKIVATGLLWSDAKRLALGLDCTIVGMTNIKKRRLESMKVPCHRGTVVGEYVPFNFCPRSIMLYILHKGNHPELAYKEGQEPIVHLQADLAATVEWAATSGVRWAFTDRNASAYVAQFFNNLQDLNRINWRAIEATDFRDVLINEGKQAEFLAYESFPCRLVEKIGVFDQRTKDQVEAAFVESGQQTPVVAVERAWYF